MVRYELPICASVLPNDRRARSRVVSDELHTPISSSPTLHLRHYSSHGGPAAQPYIVLVSTWARSSSGNHLISFPADLLVLSALSRTVLVATVSVRLFEHTELATLRGRSKCVCSLNIRLKHSIHSSRTKRFKSLFQWYPPLTIGKANTVSLSTPPSGLCALLFASHSRPRPAGLMFPKL